MTKKAWRRTYDSYAHKPNFKMTCRFHPDVNLYFRLSSLHPDGLDINGIGEPVNQIAFKCKTCGSHIRFNVRDTRKYIEKMLELRKKQGLLRLFYPPIEAWQEDEDMAEKLETLGYV